MKFQMKRHRMAERLLQEQISSCIIPEYFIKPVSLHILARALHSQKYDLSQMIPEGSRAVKMLEC